MDTAPVITCASAAAEPDHARRARFLQTVATAQATHLADNIDYLFQPFGIAIPDFVAGLGVDYRWYLQCSTMTDVDTVAFAVPVT